MLRAATTASADFSLRLLLRRPFRREARSPQVRTQSFPAQPPDLRRLSLDHKSFAEHCPLALLGTAFYPVLVHRLAVSLLASFPHSVTLVQLRFASLTVVSLREDLHLQDRAHAGRTTVQIVASHDLTLVVRRPAVWEGGETIARRAHSIPRTHARTLLEDKALR